MWGISLWKDMQQDCMRGSSFAGLGTPPEIVLTARAHMAVVGIIKPAMLLLFPPVSVRTERLKFPDVRINILPPVFFLLLLLDLFRISPAVVRLIKFIHRTNSSSGLLNPHLELMARNGGFSR